MSDPLFRRATGGGVTAYLKSLRMARARERLAKSRQCLDLIAQSGNALFVSVDPATRTRTLRTTYHQHYTWL